MKKTTFIIAMFFMLIILSGTALTEVDTEYDTALKYYNSGKYEEAVEYFKGYVQETPDASAYYRIGYALYKLGKHNEAHKYFDDAYLIDPNFSPGPFLKEKPVEGVQPEAPQVPAVAPEEPVIQKEEITLKEQPVEEIQPGVLQVPAVVPEEPVVQKEEIIPEEEAQPKMRFEPLPGFPSEEPMPLEAPKLPTGLIAALGIIYFVVVIAFYIYFSLCLFRIAKKLNVPEAWIAWIPLAQIWTVVRSADKPWWWIFLLFIPVAGAFVGIYLWMRITENLGRDKWLGLLMLVPIVNLIFLGVLAFSKEEEAAPPLTPDIT